MGLEGRGRARPCRGQCQSRRNSNAHSRDASESAEQRTASRRRAPTSGLGRASAGEREITGALLLCVHRGGVQRLMRPTRVHRCRAVWPSGVAVRRGGATPPGRPARRRGTRGEGRHSVLPAFRVHCLMISARGSCPPPGRQPRAVLSPLPHGRPPTHLACPT